MSVKHPCSFKSLWTHHNVFPAFSKVNADLVWLNRSLESFQKCVFVHFISFLSQYSLVFFRYLSSA